MVIDAIYLRNWLRIPFIYTPNYILTLMFPLMFSHKLAGPERTHSQLVGECVTLRASTFEVGRPLHSPIGNYLLAVLIPTYKFRLLILHYKQKVIAMWSIRVYRSLLYLSVHRSCIETLGSISITKDRDPMKRNWPEAGDEIPACRQSTGWGTRRAHDSITGTW